MRVRVRYSVSGKIRFISHLDLMRAFFRACIKKDIPVAMSQGFSPHLKISFGPPLSLGMTSSEEYLDMYVKGPVDKIGLQEGLPEGIKIVDIYEVPDNEPSLCVSLNRAVYIVNPAPRAKARGFGKKLLNTVLHPRSKERGFTGGGVKSPSGEELVIDVPIGQAGNVRPIDVISELWSHLGPDELRLCRIHREKLYEEK